VTWLPVHKKSVSHNAIYDRVTPNRQLSSKVIVSNDPW